MIGIKRQTQKYKNQSKQLNEFILLANSGVFKRHPIVKLGITCEQFAVACKKLSDAISETFKQMFAIKYEKPRT